MGGDFEVVKNEFAQSSTAARIIGVTGLSNDVNLPFSRSFEGQLAISLTELKELILRHRLGVGIRRRNVRSGSPSAAPAAISRAERSPLARNGGRPSRLP